MFAQLVEFETLLECAPDAMVITDSEGKIAFVNSQIAMGLTPPRQKAGGSGDASEQNSPPKGRTEASERVESIAMPKAGKKKRGRAEPPQTLKGWKAIGAYLGIGAATAQRWAKSGMPVKRQGRFTVADATEIRQWLGREAHMSAPAHVLTTAAEADVTAALKESISALRRRNRQ